MNMKKIINIILMLLLSSCVPFFYVLEEEIEPALINAELPVLSVLNNDIEILPAVGGSISLLSRRPISLNPITNVDSTVNEFLSLIFEPLFIMNEGRMEPRLAQSLIYINNSSAILTLTNSFWEDGTRVTTTDVAFTINNIRNTQQSLFDVSSIISHEIIDDLQMILNFSGIQFLEYELIFPILPQHYYQNRMNQPLLTPMGSGPFVLTEQTSQNLTLTRNENFRYATYISYINIVISPNRATDINAFLGNIANVLTTNKEEIAYYGLSISSFDVSQIFTYYLDFVLFNISNPHLAEMSVRNALSFAFPFSSIENIYLGQITRTSSFVHPNSRHYREGLYYRETNLGYALEKLLLEGYSIENEMLGNALEIFIPLRLRILVNEENAPRMALARAFALNLENLGIEAELNYLPFEQFYEQFRNSNFDILFGGVALSNNFFDTQFIAEILNMPLNYFDLYDAQSYVNEQIRLIPVGFRNDILLTRGILGNISPGPSNIFQNIHEWFVGIR